MPRLLIIGLIIAGIVPTISGQDFLITHTPDANHPKSLYLKFENTGFFKNNEFESFLVDGYTLTGNWIRPRLVYQPMENLRLELGWHYLRFNGTEKATHSLPWFSARIRFLNNWQFILGNLRNNNNHSLIKPIWEPERFITDKPEAGFQIIHHSRPFHFDGWLNWEQFIFEGDPFQEHFTAGISSGISLFRSKKITLSLPLQVLIHHQGGEIDTSPLRVQTLTNTAAGLQTEILFKGFLRQINLAAYYTMFLDNKKNSELPFEKGSGTWISGSITSKGGRFGLEYWNSEKFFGIKGMELLQVAHGIHPSYAAPNLKKEMILLFYDLKKELCEGVILGARLEAWYEPEPGSFSNTAALYAIVNKDFLLKKF
jgi:hypothetical protein